MGTDARTLSPRGRKFANLVTREAVQCAETLRTLQRKDQAFLTWLLLSGGQPNAIRRQTLSQDPRSHLASDLETRIGVDRIVDAAIDARQGYLLRDGARNRPPSSGKVASSTRAAAAEEQEWFEG